jgi:hypothetical protein
MWSIGAVLVVVLIVQVAFYRWLIQGGAVDIGDALPPMEVSLPHASTSLRLSDIVSGHDGCLLLVVCSPSCGICKQMRESWSVRVGALTNSLEAPVGEFWLFAGDTAGFGAFLNEHGRRRIGIASTTRFRTKRLVITGTPTVLLVDRKGILRDRIEGRVR